MTDGIVSKKWNSTIASFLSRPPSWTRLEPQSVTGNPAAGLAAPVHDPLWMLARQWQFGEFAGEDAGTPLAVQVEAEWMSVTAWQPGDWLAEEPAPARALDETPLEVLVERETTTATTESRVSAEAGAALITALLDANFDEAAAAIARHAPLTVEDPENGPAWNALVPVLRGRAVDANTVHTELEAAGPDDLPDWLDDAVDVGDRDAVVAITGRWLQWYRAELAVTGDASSWVGPRLEYRYSLGIGDIALRAPEAASGAADWWSFDAEATQLDNAPQNPEPLTHRSVATPLRFAGMPADRFWEFEDATIDIGALESNPHDLARLLVAECALIYGCDWLQIPFDVPVGSLVSIRNVTYRTTFGESYRISQPPTGRPAPERTWRMYVVTAAENAWEAPPEGGAPKFVALDGLLVAPVSATRIEGTPVEEVLFLRDEAANLGWAVERVIEDAAGDPQLRTATRYNTDPSVGSVQDAELDYLLQTSVPEWWIPYLPHVAHADSLVTLELIRGAMQGPGAVHIKPKGDLLQAQEHRMIYDAELPREGVRLQRVPMLSRRSDGTYDLWTARRVSVGRGEGRSGLAFDSATPRPASA